MDTKQVNDALDKLFREERVVFWNDPEQEFVSYLTGNLFSPVGFRYETAQELTQELNGKYRFEASLSSQLSVLPSYTALGMASLLPHKTLEYDVKGHILVDGKPCASSDQRNEILSSVDGMVVIG